jgi:hypothetical protein
MGLLMLRIITALLLTSCASGSNDSSDHMEPIEEVIDQKGTYLDLVEDLRGDTDFFMENDCDALLFNGLMCAAGVEIPILAARDPSGQWYRTPAHTCHKEGRSASTISSDMLIGAMWCLYALDDTTSLQLMLDYGRDHKWVMGEGPLSRTYMKPTLQRTLYALVGKSYKGPPDVWLDPGKDHSRHVVALNILLRGEKEGKITDQMLSLIEGFVEKDPANGLFQFIKARFTDGSQQLATFSLMDEGLFPKDRLPFDRCRRWLWERESSSWFGCGPKKEPATGGDFLFLASLLEEAHESKQ